VATQDFYVPGDKGIAGTLIDELERERKALDVAFQRVADALEAGASHLLLWTGVAVSAGDTVIGMGSGIGGGVDFKYFGAVVPRAGVLRRFRANIVVNTTIAGWALRVQIANTVVLTVPVDAGFTGPIAVDFEAPIADGEIALFGADLDGAGGGLTRLTASMEYAPSLG